jgi:hypothetical protein
MITCSEVLRAGIIFHGNRLSAWWDGLDESEQTAIGQIQLKIDNGPESSGVRTQFLHRMVQFADQTGKPIQLLYFPPYHSKYNPIERCWGILELHWNGSSKKQSVEIWLNSMIKRLFS